MGKDYFKDSSIPPTYNVDQPEMAIWNSFFSAQELNCSSQKQSLDCFIEPNYNCLTSESNHFSSSLSSMVSSSVPNDNFLLHKLIGNSQIDLQNCQNLELMTPLYPPIVADQGFIERAAKFSCFIGNNSLGCNDGKNSVSGANSNEKTSVSELVKSGGKLIKSQCELNSRKRKTFSQDDMVEKDYEIDKAKRSKAKEENWKMQNGGKKEKETKSGNDTSGEDESENQEKGKQKTPEALKDYIHVRARRGQATDSHSLAERVRREKISERMKLLEDLVPGCNKVTGKALMLDEIINYVQALQHQVEFLSMKLASVNTGMSSVGDNLVPKPMFQPNALYSSHPQQAPQQLKSYASTVSVSQFPVNPMDRGTGLGIPRPPLNRFGEGPPQISALCEGDLQSIVERAISHDGQNAFHSLGFLSQNQVASMKIEL
ncbi:hypothetical protein Leryth_000822 [Lithospermum erythrorhizon]|nr:hypothetical protein Leryth_000822 [Lithospermum erythrorhizon]